MTTPSGATQCPSRVCRALAPDAGELIEAQHGVTLDERRRQSAKIMYGMGDKVVRQDDLTPMRAIRLKCIDCSGGSYVEASKCHMTDCPLWKYRTGKTGHTRRKLNEDERAKRREQLQRARPR